MRCLVLYHYPFHSGGESLQGELLYQGILNSKNYAVPLHFEDRFVKYFYLKNMNIDVSFGIGSWVNVPEIIKTPLKYGVTPVPWFNSDGWVAQYKKEFESLELMFTTSKWVKSVYDHDGIDASKIVPIHVGIDTDLFRPLNERVLIKNLRNMLGVKDHEKMILTVGGDTTSKGAQEMIKALAKVDEEFKDWKYICKSRDDEVMAGWRTEEINLAKELGIFDKMIFLKDDSTKEFMAYLLNAADIYAAPSRLEGFGLIQVEAMSCGKPVISIDKMGPSETILHNKTGFLAKVGEEIKLTSEWVYPHMGFEEKKRIKFDSPKTFAYRADIEDLRKYTLKLLQDDQLREDMGMQARQHVLKNLDYRNTSQRMIDITKDKLGL